MLRDRLKAKTGDLDPYREFGPDVRVTARELAPSRGSNADDKDQTRTPFPPPGAGHLTQVPPGRRPLRQSPAQTGSFPRPAGGAGRNHRVYGGCWPGSARPSPTQLQPQRREALTSHIISYSTPYLSARLFFFFCLIVLRVIRLGEKNNPLIWTSLFTPTSENVVWDGTTHFRHRDKRERRDGWTLRCLWWPSGVIGDQDVVPGWR